MMALGKKVTFESVIALELYDGIEAGAALLPTGGWVRVRAIADARHSTGRAFIIEEIEKLSSSFHQEMTELRRKYESFSFLPLEIGDFSPATEAELNSAVASRRYLAIGDAYLTKVRVAPADDTTIDNIIRKLPYEKILTSAKSYIEQYWQSRQPVIERP